jgi:cell wall-associated NlpC family hydrolase
MCGLLSKLFALAALLVSLSVISMAANDPATPANSAEQPPAPPTFAAAPALDKAQEIVVRVITRNKADDQQSAEAAGPSTTQSPTEQARADRRSRLTREALTFRGTAYVWGGASRMGFDCSGFTQYLYAQRGVKLPHSAKLQFKMGKPIQKSDLREGDLVFFNTRGPITHVGMYIGDGNFVHAANPRRGVVVTALNSPYYLHRFAGARRYSA